jgi:antitoxin HicB
MRVNLVYKLPLVLAPQPEGGYTVTCPVLPELVSEGDTVQEALANANDALAAVLELYEDLHQPLPGWLQPAPEGMPILLEMALTAT